MSFEQNIKACKDLESLPKKKGIIKLWEIIWDFLYFKTFIGTLWEKIPAIISYIPVIWKARDWDESGVWIILAHKLKRHRECIAQGYHIEDSKIAEEIGEAERACIRLSEDDYCRKEHEEHNKKWPFKEIKFYPQTKKDKKFRVRRLKFAKGAEAKDHERIWKLEDSRREADLKLISKALVKKSGKWWC